MAALGCLRLNSNVIGWLFTTDAWQIRHHPPENFPAGLLHQGAACRNFRVAGSGTGRDAQKWSSGSLWRCGKTEMKTNYAPHGNDSGRLLAVNQYLEQNFPDFFAEARFHVGDDDYFLYSRFGQYLARSIEDRRAPRAKINRGFTVLNKMAAVSRKDPAVRRMLVSGPLEHLFDAPKARALAMKRLSPVAQGYLESLCE